MINLQEIFVFSCRPCFFLGMISARLQPVRPAGLESSAGFGPARPESQPDPGGSLVDTNKILFIKPTFIFPKNVYEVSPELQFLPQKIPDIQNLTVMSISHSLYFNNTLNMFTHSKFCYKSFWILSSFFETF